MPATDLASDKFGQVPKRPAVISTFSFLKLVTSMARPVTSIFRLAILASGW